MKIIAVIDDDVYIGDLLEEILTRDGYKVVRAYSGTEATMLLASTYVDLVLLDLMLPGLTGEQVLPSLKDIPVIVISAKVDTQSKVDLLRLGAVDYMTKPFDVDELLARIDVQFRKTTLKPKAIIHVGKIKLNPVSHEVFEDGHPIHLTKTEFAILKLLMVNTGQVLSKSAILDGISSETPDCLESSLKVHISNIRKKFKYYSDREYIESVWGIGFRFNEVN